MRNCSQRQVQQVNVDEERSKIPFQKCLSFHRIISCKEKKCGNLYWCWSIVVLIELGWYSLERRRSNLRGVTTKLLLWVNSASALEIESFQTRKLTNQRRNRDLHPQENPERISQSLICVLCKILWVQNSSCFTTATKETYVQDCIVKERNGQGPTLLHIHVNTPIPHIEPIARTIWDNCGSRGAANALVCSSFGT